MNVVYSMILGYLLGSLSPSALLGKIKKQDLRKTGTQNLGASNTLLTFGKKYGALVMLFDILKAFFAVRLARWLFPSFALAGAVSGTASVVGHVFPFYLKFKGGKGLASFGGLILGLDPVLFVFLLILCTALMFLINYSSAMPMTAAVLFPILYAFRTGELIATAITVLASILIICKHFGNVLKAIRGEEPKMRDYAKKYL